MTGLVAWTLTLAGALLLVVSGVDHLWRRSWFAAVLASHRLPGRLRRTVSVLLGPVEVLVGVLTVAVFVAGRRTWPAGWRAWEPPVSAAQLAAAQVGAALAVAVVYAGFAGYLGFLLRARPGVSCGCLPGTGEASVPGVLRALLIAGAGFVAAWSVSAGSGSAGSGSAGSGPVVLAAAVVVALIAAVVPAVLAGRSTA